MSTASKFVPRAPEACWRHFTDAATLTGWVPGLRRARVVTSYPGGLAHEVAFEFAASRTYSLVYSYDVEARAVSWAPRMGQRDAVRGSARFDAEDHGTRVTYTTEDGDGRTAADRALDAPHALLESFVRWMVAAR
ncbi:MAG: SRPBCC family protein [Myxococcales bacterium]|nr:SRPBCC family protein [Myxococcales bacterium]